MTAYVVRPGDSLSIIARDILGDMSRWPELAEQNAIEPPYAIYPGQVLQLYDSPPSDTARSSAVTPQARAPGAVSQPPWYKNKWVWFGLAAVLALASASGGRRR